MAAENSPFTIFITADDKQDIDLLAETSHSAGHRIVSLGATAELMKAAGIQVVDVHDFLGERTPAADESLEKRTYYGLLAKQLLPSLLLPYEILGQKGLPAINGAFINLTAPNAKRLPDTSGVQMLMAGQSGGRLMLTQGYEIGPYSEFLKLSPARQETSILRFKDWADSVLRLYVSDYVELAKECIDPANFFDVPAKA